MRSSDLLRSEQSWLQEGTRQFEQGDRAEWLRKRVFFEAQKGPAECQEIPSYKADTLTGFTHTNIRFLFPWTLLLTLRNLC